MTVITGALGAYAVKNIAEGARLVTETFDNSLMSISFARAAAVDFSEMESLAARRRLVADAGVQADLSSRLDELSNALNEDLRVASERTRSVQAVAAAKAVGATVAAWLEAERSSNERALQWGNSTRWPAKSPRRSTCW